MPYTYRRNILYLNNKSPLVLPHAIQGVKKSGRFLLVTVLAAKRGDQDALRLFGVNRSGHVEFQFRRAVFSKTAVADARLYIAGRRIPAAQWPDEIKRALFGKPRPVPQPQLFRDTDITTKPYHTRGSRLFIKGCRPLRFSCRIADIVKSGTMLVVLTEAITGRTPIPNVYGVDPTGTIRWRQIAGLPHPSPDDVCTEVCRNRKLVRLFTWGGRVTDVDPRTGRVVHDCFGR